jgi:hypothetical protein
MPARWSDDKRYVVAVLLTPPVFLVEVCSAVFALPFGMYALGIRPA